MPTACCTWPEGASSMNMTRGGSLKTLEAAVYA